MPDVKRPLSKPPPRYLTRENAIANLKSMMPPPGYGEDQIIPAPGAGGGNAQLMNRETAASSLDRANVARPPAPPVMMSPNPPTAVPPRDIPNVAQSFHSPQARPGYGGDGTVSDPSVNPSGFLTGQQYNAIPPSVPAPVKAYMGNNPTTGAAKGGPIGLAKGGSVGWRKHGW